MDALHYLFIVMILFLIAHEILVLAMNKRLAKKIVRLNRENEDLQTRLMHYSQRIKFYSSQREMANDTIKNLAESNTRYKESNQRIRKENHELKLLNPRNVSCDGCNQILDIVDMSSTFTKDLWLCKNCIISIEETTKN